MNMQQEDSTSIQIRLRALESQGKVLKLTVVILSLAAGCLVFMAAGTDRSKILEGEGIILRDATGKVRGKIETGAEIGIVQTLLDSKGKDRVRLSVDPQGIARIRLLDDTGQIRVSTSTFPADDPTTPSMSGLSVFGPYEGDQVKSSIQILAEKDGTVTQRLYDLNGVNRIGLGANPDKSAFLGVFGKSTADKCALEMGTLGDGGVYNQLFGADGKPSLAQSSNPNGWTSQQFFGADGKVSLVLASNQDGTVTQQFTGRDGKERMSFNILKNGVVNQKLSDSNGRLRVLAYSDAEGDSKHQTFDKDGKLIEAIAPTETRVVMRPPIESPPPAYKPPSTFNPAPKEEKPREEQCLACQGSGQTTCGDCHGVGTIRCTKCDAAAKVKCTKCDANGMVTSGFFTKTKSETSR